MTLLWLLSCRPLPPDVLLVTLDTTRADHIGAYGAASALTPSLDALAERGTRYDQAWSPIPLTIPAHASLFTGRWPPRHGIRANGDAALAPELPTLAEQLRAHGYATGASVGAYVTSSIWGFSRGFDAFFEPEAAGRFVDERPAEEVLEDALRWEEQTRGGKAPRFFWMHLFDPHLPNTGSTERDPYDEAITRADSALGALVRAFDRRPSLVVVAADHGEGRGDHGELAHGLFLYPETLRVPLVLSGPGVEPGAVVDTPVSLVDVAPTVLSLLDLPPLPDADGQPLPAPARPLYLESWQLAQRFGLAAPRGLVTADPGPTLLVDLPRPELYDLGADPGALHDRAATEPQRTDALRALLNRWDFPPPGAPSADPGLAAQLLALGYAAPAAPTEGALPDPKDHRSWLARSQQVDTLVAQGQLEAAQALLGELSSERPGLADPASRRAWLLLRLGRAEEAADVLKAALQQTGPDPALMVALGTALASARRFEEAAGQFLAAAERSPSPGPRILALRALLDAGQFARAAEIGRSFSEALPSDAAIAGLYGLALVRMGRMPEAIALLERGAGAAVPERGVLFHLSALAAGRGDREAAIALLDRELALYPAHGEALSVRCRFHQRAGEYPQMVALAERALALRPGDRAASACLALARAAGP